MKSKEWSLILRCLTLKNLPSYKMSPTKKLNPPFLPSLKCHIMRKQFSTTDQIFAHWSDKKIVWKEKTIQWFWVNLCIFLNEGNLKNTPPYSIWGKKESFQKNQWLNFCVLVRRVIRCLIFGLQMTNFS